MFEIQKKKQEEIDSKMTVDIDFGKGTATVRMNETDPDAEFGA